ncbi:MAG: hypothetical protein KF764_31640 [Labilithrix sp.]|nr:hypothetical protein [Labilithrix sp.]
MRAPYASIAIAACVVTSCTLLTPLDGFDEPRSDDAGAPTSDAEAGAPQPSVPDKPDSSDEPTEETDAGSDGEAAPVVLSEDSFEADTSCAPWLVDRGQAKAGSPGRTGSKSCEICFESPSAKGRIARTYPAVDPGTWKVEAWVQRDSGSGVCKVSSNGVSSDHPFGASWTRIEHVSTVSTRRNVEVRIEFDSSVAGECMYLDDVRITRVP